MEKKLPGVFANTINKSINNNEKVYTGNNKEKTNDTNPSPKPKINIEKSVNQKIEEIFKSRKYIYKIPVKIETETEEIIKNLIGKNNKNLITIDNELIEIDKIKDIQLLEQEKNEQ